LTVLVGTIAGAAIGLVSGYWSGWSDILVQRLLDSLQSIPGLLLALVVAAVIGTGTRFGINLAVVPIAVILIPINARVVRSAVLSAREQSYVEAAHVLGCTDGRIMLRHILPNVAAPILILASVYIGNAIIVEASLSFL